MITVPSLLPYYSILPLSYSPFDLSCPILSYSPLSCPILSYHVHSIARCQCATHCTVRALVFSFLAVHYLYITLPPFLPSRSFKHITAPSKSRHLRARQSSTHSGMLYASLLQPFACSPTHFYETNNNSNSSSAITAIINYLNIVN